MTTNDIELLAILQNKEIISYANYLSNATEESFRIHARKILNAKIKSMLDLTDRVEAIQSGTYIYDDGTIEGVDVPLPPIPDDE